MDSADVNRTTRHEHGIPVEGKNVINIDHHHTNPRFGQINLIDAKACSTAEIVYNLFIKWGYEISTETANCLLCAISGDTESFRWSTTSNTFIAAANLLEKGASLKDVDFNLYRRVPLQALKYQAEVIQNAQTFDVGGKRLLFAAMPSEKVKDLGGLEFAHGGAQQMNNIEGIDIGIVIYEEEDGFISGGLRARTDVDVSEIAALFGGGGHKAAAGFHIKIKGDFEQKKKYILEKIVDYLKNEKN